MPTVATSSRFPLCPPREKFISLWFYLSILLLGSFLYLPRTPFQSLTSHPSHISSKDRPQHPFLTPLTINPRRTMLHDVAGMLLCMMWWGGYMRQWCMPRARAQSLPDARDQRVKAFCWRVLEAIIATIIVALLIVPALVLFGAPIQIHAADTVLLAFHLSILCTWPLIFALGLPDASGPGTTQRFQLKRMLCDWRSEHFLEAALLSPTLGALIGAWLGGTALPLDWDRPWQAYPLPSTAGSIIGFLAGGFITSWTHVS